MLCQGGSFEGYGGMFQCKGWRVGEEWGVDAAGASSAVERQYDFAPLAATTVGLAGVRLLVIPPC